MHPHDLAHIRAATRQYRADLQVWQHELGLRTEVELHRFLANAHRSEKRNPRNP